MFWVVSLIENHKLYVFVFINDDVPRLGCFEFWELLHHAGIQALQTVISGVVSPFTIASRMSAEIEGRGHFEYQ